MKLNRRQLRSIIAEVLKTSPIDLESIYGDEKKEKDDSKDELPENPYGARNEEELAAFKNAEEAASGMTFDQILDKVKSLQGVEGKENILKYFEILGLALTLGATQIDRDLEKQTNAVFSHLARQ